MSPQDNTEGESGPTHERSGKLLGGRFAEAFTKGGVLGLLGRKTGHHDNPGMEIIRRPVGMAGYVDRVLDNLGAKLRQNGTIDPDGLENYETTLTRQGTVNFTQLAPGVSFEAATYDQDENKGRLPLIDVEEEQPVRVLSMSAHEEKGLEPDSGSSYGIAITVARDVASATPSHEYRLIVGGGILSQKVRRVGQVEYHDVSATNGVDESSLAMLLSELPDLIEIAQKIAARHAASRMT